MWMPLKFAQKMKSSPQSNQISINAPKYANEALTANETFGGEKNAFWAGPLNASCLS